MTWPKVKLGEVLTQYKEYIDAPEAKLYPKLSVKLYGRGVTLDTPSDGTQLKMKRHQLAKVGQVILSEIWGKKGAIGIVPENGAGALCTSHFFLFDINHDKLMSDWLRYIFRANYLEQQLDSEAKGTTGYAAIRPAHLLKAEVPLPPLAEQRRLVARIDALAAKIDEAKQLRTRAGIETGYILQSAVDQEFNTLADGGSWFRVPLREAATIRRGKFAHRPRNEPRFYGGCYPFIQIGDISASRRHIRRFSQTLNEQGLAISRMFPKGTVAIAITGATVGVTGILDFDSCFPDSIVGIEAIPGITSSTFIFWALEFEKHHVLAQATQTTQPNINLEKLDSLSVILPPLEVQTVLNNRLESVVSRIDLVEREQASSKGELDALLPAILDRAFRGEL